MKRVFLLMGIIFFMFITACSNNDPMQIARNFFTAVAKGNKKAAEQFMSPQYLRDFRWEDRRGFLGEVFKKYDSWDEGFEGFMKFVVESGKIIGVGIKSRSSIIEEYDAAIITVNFENYEGMELEMMKIDEKWKIVRHR